MKLSKRQDLDQHLDRVGFHTKLQEVSKALVLTMGTPKDDIYRGKESSQTVGKKQRESWYQRKKTPAKIVSLGQYHFLAYR